MKNKSKFLGFTLIELLFVIAIASVLVSLGLTMVKQRGQQAKVEKTALQMQQLMQAGMAYYVDNHCWPVSPPGTPTGCSTPTPPSFDGYIPINGKINSWGYTYSWSPQTNGRFEVRVNTPDPSTADPTATNNPIARRIAGMLPNAAFGINTVVIAGSCTTSNCVYAQATIPAQSSGSSVIVVATGAIHYNGGGGTKDATFGDFTKDSDDDSHFTATKSTVNFNCPASYPFSAIQIAPKISDFNNTNYTASTKDRLSPIFPIQVDYNTALVTSSSSHYNITIDTHARACYVDYGSSHVAYYMHCHDSGYGAHKGPKQGGQNLFKTLILGYTVYCCSNTNVCPANPTT